MESKRHFREHVLDMSLNIEYFLSQLLFIQFKITKEECKTLSHTSSALSFKNKADLILDLNKISSETHKKLICFMEIRNQFIHNLSCSDIYVATTRLNKTNYLKNFSEQAINALKLDGNDAIKISGLEISFYNLYGEILSDLKKASDIVVEERMESINLESQKEQNVFLNEMIEMFTTTLDKTSDLFDEAFEAKSINKEGRFKTAFLVFFLSEYKRKYPESKASELLNKFENN